MRPLYWCKGKKSPLVHSKPKSMDRKAEKRSRKGIIMKLNTFLVVTLTSAVGLATVATYTDDYISPNHPSQLENATLSTPQEEPHWAADYIEEMMALGFLTGKDDQNFDPDGSLTLAEFATMISNGFYGLNLAEEKAKSHWYAPEDWWIPYFKATNTRNGLTQTLAQEESAWQEVAYTSIRRYDMAMMIYNLLQDRYVPDLSQDSIDKALLTFSDEIDPVYQEAVAMSSHYRFFSGNPDGTFDGNATVTRGQAAVVLWALVGSELISTEESRHYEEWFPPLDFIEPVKLLDVPLLYQKDTLPEGCEVTSLTAVLNYYGFDAKKENLSEEFLPRVSTSASIKNPDEAYIGNPANVGWYCFEHPLVICGNLYLNSIGSDFWVAKTDITTIDQFIHYINADIPVIVWATTNYGTPVRSSTVSWNTGYGTVRPYTNLHCITMVGYDTEQRLFYIADSLQPNGNKLVEIDMDKFMNVYAQMGNRSLIVAQ